MSGTFQRPSQSTMFVGRSDLGVGGSEYIRHEYMTKQGAVVKNWKRRYFSLSPDKMQIAYYKTAGDCLEKKKPMGVIPLDDARARRAEYDPKQIYYPKFPKKRIYKIVAGSAHAANSWLNTINELTSQERSSVILPATIPITQSEMEIEVDNNDPSTSPPTSPTDISISTSPNSTNPFD